MDYKGAIEYLMSALPMFQRSGSSAFNKNLDRTNQLMEALNMPHQKFKAIHVGGTNGKGSCSHMLASVYQLSGLKTGLYTSPHLKSFRERIKINGREIPENEVVNFVHNYGEMLEEIKPSFFEMSVAMAFEYFANEKVDIAIIEVGMGGRLDSTNIINPVLSLITNVSLDHQQFLGETLPKIAFEKAGIIKFETPCVIGEYSEHTFDTFKDQADNQEAPLTLADHTYSLLSEEQGMLIIDREGNRKLDGINPPIKGNYVRKNIISAYAAISLLQNSFPVSNDLIRKGLNSYNTLTGLKGRWQVLSESPLTICDTGHNESAIKIIVDQLESMPAHELWIVWGMVGDKDHDAILNLLPKHAKYIFCEPKIPRKLDAQSLSEKAESFGLKGQILSDVNQAVKLARKLAKPNDMIFIGGSTFVVAEIDEL